MTVFQMLCSREHDAGTMNASIVTCDEKQLFDITLVMVILFTAAFRLQPNTIHVVRILTSIFNSKAKIKTSLNSSNEITAALILKH